MLTANSSGGATNSGASANLGSGGLRTSGGTANGSGGVVGSGGGMATGSGGAPSEGGTSNTPMGGMAGGTNGASDLSRGLITHFAFEESTGSTATDSIGNVALSVVNCAALGGEGHLGKGLSLGASGANHCYGEAINPGVDIGRMTQVTLSVWFKYTGGQKSYPANIFSLDHVMNVEWDGDGTLAWSGCCFVETHAAAPSLDAWHHMAGTWDTADGSIHLFIDGVEVSQNSDPIVGRGHNTVSTPSAVGMVSDASNQLEVGSLDSYAPDGFVGAIDEIRLYNRVLSSEEIKMLAAQ